MSDYFGMPGIGGGMGCCALCGDNFLVEVMVGNMLGKKVVPFRYGDESITLFAHESCIKPYQSGKTLDVTTLSDKSPLKRACMETTKK